MVKSMEYPASSNGLRVKLAPFPTPPKRKKRETKRQAESAEAEIEQARICESIKTFIELTRWQEPAEDQTGVSWMELFIRYYQVGGYLGRKRSADEHYIADDNLRVLLPRFKRHFRKVVDRASTTKINGFSDIVERLDNGCLRLELLGTLQE